MEVNSTMGNWRFYGGNVWKNGKLQSNNYFDIKVVNEADREIYLPEQSMLLPGLIDFHCHLWAPGADVAVTDTEYLSSGVVACGDAGTFGYDGWKNADRLWQSSALQVRSWLSVLPEGLTIHPNPSPTSPDHISMEKLLETASEGEGRLLGYKIRLGQVDEKTDRGLLRVAREAAEKSNLKVMAHLTDTFLPIEEVVEILRPGDVLTHPYHGNRGNILNQQGEVSIAFKKAVEKGLILDVGQGSKHFSWTVFKQAVLEEGIKPHTISSDIVRKTWLKEPVKDMSYIISRFIAAGLSKEEVIRSVLTNSADLMGIELEQSKNLVVLQPVNGDFHYLDSEGQSIESNQCYDLAFNIHNERTIYVNDSISNNVDTVRS
jgi:dihydroorotase